MKARYNGLPDKRAKEVYSRRLQEMQTSFAQLYEKVLLYTLHTDFGYGRIRLSNLIQALSQKVDEMAADPVFWDRVDKDVIDNMGFDYPRCDCEMMEKVFYKPPEVTVAEKRESMRKLAAMREYILNSEDKKI